MLRRLGERRASASRTGPPTNRTSGEGLQTPDAIEDDLGMELRKTVHESAGSAARFRWPEKLTTRSYSPDSGLLG